MLPLQKQLVGCDAVQELTLNPKTFAKKLALPTSAGPQRAENFGRVKNYYNLKLSSIITYGAFKSFLHLYFMVYSVHTTYCCMSNIFLVQYEHILPNVSSTLSFLMTKSKME